MKYIKLFEKIKGRNIEIGRIYRIREISFGSDIHSMDRSIPLCRITGHNKWKDSLIILTFSENNFKELEFTIPKGWLMNIASQSEIDEFEAIENSKKYNL